MSNRSNHPTGGGDREFDSIDTEKASIGPDSRPWGDTIHVFDVAGQSNAEGKGDLGGSNGGQVPVDSTTAIQYAPDTDSLIEPLQDPFSDENFGSAWPAFAQRYYQLTGIKSCYINSAVRGSAMHPDAASGFGSWDSSDTLRSDAVSDVNNCLTKLKSKGYDPEFKGFLWSQGENDADAIDGATITRDQYGTELRNLVDYFGSQFGDAGVLWIFQTGVPDGGDTAGYHAVRLEQLEVIREKTRARLASDIQQRFPQDGKMVTGEVHYAQSGLNEMGFFGAETLVRGFEPESDRYRARADFTGAPSIAAGGFSTVPFDNEVLDRFEQFDTGTYAYTAPSDGIYQIETRVSVNNSFPADTRFKIEIRVNGSAVQSLFGSVAISDYHGFDIVAREELKAEDTVTVAFRHQDASSQKLYGDSSNTKFDIRWDALAHS